MNTFPVESERVSIQSLVPVGDGHQFIVYGDSCSGVPGAAHEATLAKINTAISHMSARPEFIAFLGDEIIGLVNDAEALRTQWRHWHQTEMKAISDLGVPLYNIAGNHTVFSADSEQVFREMNAHLPQNGPENQQGLSYFVRHGDLLVVFVNTMCRGLGGEGHMETEWLAQVMKSNGDARWKLVAGHHPAFAVNGYSGPYQRTIGEEYATRFWDLLVEHEVTAYLCSHILAFDVQVHRGVLQITTGGAGTAHLSPPDHEYHHFVQACVDTSGFRLQVVDETGLVRERLSWPPLAPDCSHWLERPEMSTAKTSGGDWPEFIAFRLRGRLSNDDNGEPQTLIAMPSEDGSSMPLWIGLVGRQRRLTVLLQPVAGRSPHGWHGPCFDADGAFDVQLAVHFRMGPGGILWRDNDEMPWSSMQNASSWGCERLDHLDVSRLIFGRGADAQAPFRGDGLRVSCYAASGAES
ncbi:metallophosphoesterase family protein [Hoeflea sp.]|uniref:metallophosphoesterase family protein n=1 Tax=Hoeflea sp. TaxID=1940281 RepID=UPI003B022545